MKNNSAWDIFRERPKSAESAKIVETVTHYFKENPYLSTRRVSASIRISRKSVW